MRISTLSKSSQETLFKKLKQFGLELVGDFYTTVYRNIEIDNSDYPNLCILPSKLLSNSIAIDTRTNTDNDIVKLDNLNSVNIMGINLHSPLYQILKAEKLEIIAVSIDYYKTVVYDIWVSSNEVHKIKQEKIMKQIKKNESVVDESNQYFEESIQPLLTRKMLGFEISQEDENLIQQWARKQEIIDFNDSIEKLNDKLKQLS